MNINILNNEILIKNFFLLIIYFEKLKFFYLFIFYFIF